MQKLILYPKWEQLAMQLLEKFTRYLDSSVFTSVDVIFIAFL